jgi:hypothetical protein
LLTSAPSRFVAVDGEYGYRADQETGGIVEAARETPTTGLAAWGGGLASPGVAVLALTAESDGSVGDSTTRALATPLVGENDGESEIVHSNHLLHSALLRIVGWALLPRYEKECGRE